MGSKPDVKVLPEGSGAVPSSRKNHDRSIALIESIISVTIQSGMEADNMLAVILALFRLHGESEILQLRLLR
jgi:hypothetical protein